MTTLQLRVARKTSLAQDIAGFELVRPEGGPLPAFSAGAHIDVQFEHVEPVYHPFHCRHCGWSGSWPGSVCPECGGQN